jgi:hypothetical protein
MAFALLSLSVGASAQDQPAPWRGWLSLYGGSAEYSAAGTPGAQNLKSSRFGVSLGTDREFDGGWLGGGSLSLGQQTFSSTDTSGSSDDVLLGLYGRKTFLGQGYLSAFMVYGWHDITSIRLAAGIEREQGKLVSREFGGRVEAGYRWWLDPVYSVAPFFAVGAESFYTPAYSETPLNGFGLFSLSYAAHETPVAHTELGGRLGRNFALENGTLWSELTLGWAHQLDDTAYGQTAFSGLSGNGFAINAITPTANTVLLGLNLQGQEKGGRSYGLRFDSQFGGNTTFFGGSGNIAWHW